MTYEEAISKVQKLLRLAQSDNPNEAGLAAARAQEIMDRYSIEAGALAYEQGAAPQEDIKDFKLDPLMGDEPRSTWRGRLVHVVCTSNGCRAYGLSTGGYSIVGRPSDVSTVRYLFAWMRREVDRLANRDCKGYGRTFSNNFRIGVVETIKSRLDEQRKTTVAKARAELTDSILFAGLADAAQSLALVRVTTSIEKFERRDEEVGAWIKVNVKGLRTVARRFKSHNAAREAGRIAGKEVRFTKAVASLGN